jgi:hypothetical protein
MGSEKVITEFPKSYFADSHIPWKKLPCLKLNANWVNIPVMQQLIETNASASTMLSAENNDFNTSKNNHV